MKKTIRQYLSTVIILWMMFCYATTVYATHNRAGEITVEQMDPLMIKATITTYTVTTSVQADRDSLTLCWGDGICEVLVRINGADRDGDGFPDGDLLPNNTKRNIYMAFHVYQAPGTYTLSMTDPNRNEGILNVNFPNSGMIEFHLQTTYTLLNQQFQGSNNTPILLQPPIDVGCVGQPFIHNPNAYDEDGDSLSYELIVPLRGIDEETGEDIPVPNYAFPEMISTGAGNVHFLDPVTGDFVWTAPQRAGEYNIAMIIVEYRQGIPIDTMIRDMQILILGAENCENQPPKIETVEEICVVAGELLEFDVVATDPDIPQQQVDLTALGGPFEVETSPAEFIVSEGFQSQPLTGTFRWQTTCDHISDQNYSVVFRSSDDFVLIPADGNPIFLSTLKTVQIKVVGPPPEDVLATVDQEEITVTWENPYFCDMAANGFFNGFSVWRRVGSNQFPIDTCSPGGLEQQGYMRLTTGNISDINNAGRYFFVDTDVDRGRTYCYRIVGNFAKISSAGFPFNPIEGLPSEEFCIQLDREVPLITNVDVRVTDINNGQIEVRWTKPLLEDLDTIANPGPYRYVVSRATGFSTDFTAVPGADFVSGTFEGANDTVFLDMGLNTVANSYTYQVSFFVGGENEPLGVTNPASSIFLTTAPTDRAVDLSWEEQVPWDNFEYVIFRQNAQGIFDSIGISTVPMFRDEGLENGVEFCYKVLGRGTYGLDAEASPLLNFSQEVCTTPGDNVPPCPPTLTVINICDEGATPQPEEDLFNTLSWTNPDDICEDPTIDTDDTDSYNIYFTEMEGGELTIIETIVGATNTTFDHQPSDGIAGCYAVSAIDMVGNESSLSNIVCVDNCPFYELPNTFTPNGDGTNDIFKPFPFRFIDRVEFKVFNRWGGLVFETTDPNLNWDGTNLSGDALSDGVYFYTCQVFESRVTGVVEQETILNGAINLLGGGE